MLENEITNADLYTFRIIDTMEEFGQNPTEEGLRQFGKALARIHKQTQFPNLLQRGLPLNCTEEEVLEN